MTYNLFKLSFTGTDSFFMSYTKFSINKGINEILYRYNFRPAKYKKLFDFIDSVGIELMIVDDLGKHTRIECLKLIKEKKPNLN